MVDFTHRSSSGSSMNNTRISNNFDAGASERLRTEAAIAERNKSDQMRARQQIMELERKLDHNRREISSKNIEIRRLTQEVFHADALIKSVEQEFNLFDSKDKESNLRVHNFQIKLQESQKKAIKSRLEIEEKKREEKKLEGQVTELQRKLGETRRALQEAEQNIKEIDLEMRHLEGSMHMNADNFTNNTNKRSEKQKEVDNKKKAIYALEQKKKFQTGEIERLVEENERIQKDMSTLHGRIR